jgi:hypothetical protein
MNRRMIVVLGMAAAGVIASLYRNQRAWRAATAPRESAAERSRWEGEGGSVSARPADTPVGMAEHAAQPLSADADAVPAVAVDAI